MGFIYTQKEYKETGHSQNRPTTDSRSREMAMLDTDKMAATSCCRRTLYISGYW